MQIRLNGSTYDVHVLAHRLALGQNTIPPRGRKLTHEEISQIRHAAEKMQIRLNGSTYDVHALAHRLAIGQNTIPPSGRKLTHEEISQIWDAAEKIGWNRRLLTFHGVRMVPGNHSDSGISTPSTHDSSNGSVGRGGWIARGHAKPTARRMHYRERRLRRMETPSKNTTYSWGYRTNPNSSGSNGNKDVIRNEISSHWLPNHLSYDDQMEWAEDKAHHQIQKARRRRRHARQVIQRRNAHKQTMLELRHAPPRTHHPGFPGGSNYHASKRRWNEMHESPTAKKPRKN